jgi:membrane protease YdiL (CAAX protease family)
MADPLGPGASGEGSSDRSQLAVAAVVVYAVFAAGGWLWLWLRDRTQVIPHAAFGELGILRSAALGAATGLVLSGVFAAAVRYLGPCARLEQRLHGLLGSLGEREITVLALSSALGEEFFFRLAMQDALGLFLTAAVFGLLHVGPKGTWLWTATSSILGLGFGWMMQLGCGLLSVTVAHALVNYLSLRRMQRP